jgi:hypothetical protein
MSEKPNVLADKDLDRDKLTVKADNRILPGRMG